MKYIAKKRTCPNTYCTLPQKAPIFLSTDQIVRVIHTVHFLSSKVVLVYHILLRFFFALITFLLTTNNPPPPRNDCWLVVLGIYVALVLFQPFRDLEAGDYQSVKFKWRGIEPRTSCSASQELNQSATAVSPPPPSLFPK